ncbi:hypothetical protein H4S03_009509, partial [Coemansia sp. S3946]
MISRNLNKVITEINKSSGPAINDASTSVHKAMTPEIRQKVKKAIQSVVDSTLTAL